MRAARRLRIACYLACLSLPLAAAALYAWSGGGGLTARERRREVVEQDALFGPQTRVVLTPGPVLGWYVGWDALVVAGAAAALGGGLTWVTGRARNGSRV